MTSRFDLISPRPKKDGTTYWHKLGAAFPLKSGDGYQLVFDALPLADAEGRVTLLMKPPKDRDGDQRPQGQSSGAPAGGSDMDQEIPFAPW